MSAARTARGRLLRRRRRRRLVVLLALPVLVLAGCTGVPDSSAPVVVRSLPIGGIADQVEPVTPQAGIAPRNLVEGFLEANVLDASEHASARAYLTPSARNRWSDTVATVVDSTTVSVYQDRQQSVDVYGRVLGTVDTSGIYTPTLAGTEGTRTAFVYGIRQSGGEYRIDSLRSGLLLTETDFLNSYTQRSVYFFDLDHHYLVPDPRWTSLTDPTQLADWLMARIAGDASDELQSTVSTDTLPAQANARRIVVTSGSPTKIEIPGSSQLNAAGRNRLAAQVGTTLADVGRSDLEITDNGRPVTIPELGHARFGPTTFAGTVAPQQPPPDVYFLRDGKLVGEDARDLKGAVNGTYYLQSVAVSRSVGPDTLSVAAVVAAGQSQRLLVGTQAGGLHGTSIRGTLTRPAYAPGRDEVWVGSGEKVFVVDVNARTGAQRVVPVGLPSTVSGQIIALRLSPEGSRIAIVLKSANGDQKLYVGAVVRGAGQVGIDTLTPVTPEGVVISDLAWAEPLKLLAIGYNASSLDGHVYDVGADGSGFSSQGTGDLPQPPTTLTVAVNQPAWVTASLSVWEQSFGSTWLSPGTSDQTMGYDPVYLE